MFGFASAAVSPFLADESVASDAGDNDEGATVEVEPEGDEADDSVITEAIEAEAV